MYTLKIVIGICLYSSVFLCAMENTVAMQEYNKKLLYLKTRDNKSSELSVKKAQESIPLRMFIERFGVNTKETPLAVNYTKKEIEGFSHVLDTPIDVEKALDVAQRFKALNLYGKCIAHSMPKDVERIIAQHYLPSDMLTHQIIKWGYAKKNLNQSLRLKYSSAIIDFGSNDDCFTIITGQQWGFKKCQLWSLKNNQLKQEFRGLELTSKLSPLCNYFVINITRNESVNETLIFYDINHDHAMALHSDTRNIFCFCISSNESFCVAQPCDSNPDTITMWSIDKKHVPQKLPSNKYLSNIIVKDILLRSDGTHMFVLCNTEILLFDLMVPDAVPIVIASGLSIDKDWRCSLHFAEDEMCIAIKHSGTLQHLYNISNRANVIDLSPIFQKKEYYRKARKYIKSFNAKQKQFKNKKGLVFIEKNKTNSIKDFGGFTLNDQSYNTILSYNDIENKEKELSFKGALTLSGNNLIVLALDIGNGSIYNMLMPYYLIRFTLMTDKKEKLINALLEKLTLEQSIFLYSLFKGLLIKEKYSMCAHSLESIALDSFNKEERELLTDTFPIIIL